jgi:hypothetical protein
VYRLLAVCLAACASSAVPQALHRTSPLPVAHHEWTCTEAALGLEHGSVDVRAPETSVLQVMREHCTDDRWPDYAIECFAKMQPGDLGHCAAQLADGPRDRLLAELVPGDVDREDAADKLGGDRQAARTVALAEVQLEASDVWSLPTHDLPPNIAARMAAACTAQLAELEKLDSPCKP